MNQTVFCIARVGEPVETLDGYDVEFVHTELPDTDAVIKFLQDTYALFATQLADQNTEQSKNERIDRSTIGGFIVQLTNRFGGEIEIGLGRQLCLLIRLAHANSNLSKPDPSRRNTGFLNRWMASYRKGSFATCCTGRLFCLRAWLETNVCPAVE